MEQKKSWPDFIYLWLHGLPSIDRYSEENGTREINGTAIRVMFGATR